MTLIPAILIIDVLVRFIGSSLLVIILLITKLLLIHRFKKHNSHYDCCFKTNK